VTVALMALGVAACSTTDETTTTPVAESTATTAPAAATLDGEWERVDSTFTSIDGMVVRVEGAEAVIVSVPENEFQFQAGDVKWRNISQTSETEYTFEDLVREEGTGAMSYIEGVITVNPDGPSLEMTFPTSGTVQQWQPA
jgi:hypothetical protein